MVEVSNSMDLYSLVNLLRLFTRLDGLCHIGNRDGSLIIGMSRGGVEVGLDRAVSDM